MIYTGGRKNGYLESAVVGKAHGLKGYVTLKALGGAPERFKNLPALYALEGKNFIRMEIEQVNLGNALTVKFKGVNDRTAAEKLAGLTLYRAPEDEPKLEEGEYFIADLIGCEVYSTNGTLVGKVEEVLSHGAADVYVLRGPRGSVMFPALKRLLVQVNTAEKKITVQQNVLEEVALYEDQHLDAFS